MWEMLWLAAFFLFASVGKGDPQIKTKYVCPQDFHLVGRKCYHFSENSVTWQDSHDYCQTLNGSLAIVEPQRDVNLLWNYLNQTVAVLGKYERWIDGIYDWKQMTWRWGSSGQQIHFNKFSRMNRGPKYNWTCIVMNPVKQNRWTARKCTDNRRYICETGTRTYIQFKLFNKKIKRNFNIAKCSRPELLNKYEEKKCLKMLGTVENNEPAYMIENPRPAKSVVDADEFVCSSHMVGLGNRCYYFSPDKATWWNAYHSCKRNKTKLAIIRNRSQDFSLRIFLNYFIEKQDRWIGGMYDWMSGQWKWAKTAQPLKYRGFDEAVIKTRTNESLVWNTIFMDPSLKNRWNAAKEVEKKHYICQVKAKAVKKFSHPKLKPSQATISIIP